MRFSINDELSVLICAVAVAVAGAGVEVQVKDCGS
uniref:Uncharacterized protein n=1 Tax=Phakopsora pachyrhizi TaxID=170000 RepID=A0A0S1MJH6_PHAPC